MSHEIMEHDKQEGRKQAWHGLTVVNPELSLANCHLRNWDYIAKPVTVEGMETPFSVLGVTDNCQVDKLNENGEVIGKYPLTIGEPFNTDTFKPITNAQLLDVIAEAVDGKGLTLESCGTVFNRGRQFLSLALPDNSFVAAGREFKSFLNIGNGNNQTSPLWVNTSNICTVCNNTFSANMALAGLIMAIKKTKFSKLKMENFGRAIEAMLNGQKEFAKSLGLLGNKACDEKTAREFFAGFITGVSDNATPLSTRGENTLNELVALFNHGAGNDGNDFSDVFQAATDYFTHTAASGQDNDAAKWKNFVSSEFGSGKTAKQECWSILNNEKVRKAVIAFGKRVLKVTADEARKPE